MINGTILSYYFHCKRRCWLCFNRINLEDNSEDVRIGKILHELKEDKKSEILIDGIKIDKISKNFIIEYKKTDSDIKSAEMQLLLYLYILKSKGIELSGKLEFLEKGTSKNVIITLDEEKEKGLLTIIDEIEKFLISEQPPEMIETKKCKRCAYRDYCLL